MVYQETLTVKTRRPGLLEITSEVREVLNRSSIRSGLCHIFIPHTSASLLITENADPSARRDVENYFARLAPSGDPRYTHTTEGPDDMPAHLRAALTRCSETIPVAGGSLLLGTWQGIFLFEHRDRPHERRLHVGIVSS